MKIRDPRQTLSSLEGGEPLPYSEDELSRARAVLGRPEEATPEAFSQLPEPLALALVEAVARARAADALDALSASSNKAVAKAARKALYQLRSAGVAVPEKKAAPSPAPAASGEELPPSLVSAITGTGERALIIGRPVRGRVETLQLVIADEHGVVHLGLNEISRGQYRKLLKDARRPDAPSSVELPFEDARALLAEAAGQNLRSKTPFPEGLDSALRHLSLTPAGDELQVPPPEDGDAALQAKGATLHQEPELSQWLPPVDALEDLGKKANEIATSALYVDEQQRAQQLQRTVHQSAEAFFTEPMARLYGRRLWQMADFFQRTGRLEQAALARAEARRLFHRAEGPFSPFAVRLFEKVLLLSLAPGAQLPGVAPSPEPEPGKGGLILP